MDDLGNPNLWLIKFMIHDTIIYKRFFFKVHYQSMNNMSSQFLSEMQ